MIREFGAKRRKHLTCASLIVFLLATPLPGNIARAQELNPTPYTFEECDQITEANLRDELNRIAQSVTAAEQGGLDILAIVERNWMALDLDSTVDTAVAAATARVKEETDLWDRFISGWSPEKAQELAEKVATDAFNSETFRAAFDQLSSNISDDIVAEIRLMTVKSASSALLCVQTFIGDTISPTMAALLEEQIKTRLDEISPDPDADVNWLDIATANPNLLVGVGVIVGTQIAKRLGQKLAQQIAGKVAVRVLGRLGAAVVPLVGWILGAGLIVWDLFKAREGSLPQIQKALQDPEVKEEIRAQVAEKLGEQLRVELPTLARDVSNDVYSQWREFRKKYARVLDLAEMRPRFREILDKTPVEEVGKLAEFVAVAEAKLGRERLDSLIETGDFERILGLPEEILLMLELGVDPDEVIGWADLAGELIVQVVETELYRVAMPSDFRDRADLERVVALEEAELIQKLMLLERDARDALLGLSSAHTTQILGALSGEELSWLAKEYLAQLEPQDRNRLAERIVAAPAMIPELKVDAVRKALLGSGDMEALLRYISQRTKEANWIDRVAPMLASIGPVLSGDLPQVLFWRYDAAILGHALLIFVGLIGLIIVWRRVSGPRRQDVNVTVVLPPGGGNGNGNETDAKRSASGDNGEDGR